MHPSLWRPVVLLLQSGTWAARRAESVRSFLLSCFARPWPPARAIRSRYSCAVSTLMSLGFHHQVELCDDENAMTFVVRAYINAYSRLSFKDIGREGLSRGHHRETSRRLQQAHRRCLSTLSILTEATPVFTVLDVSFGHNTITSGVSAALGY